MLILKFSLLICFSLTLFLYTYGQLCANGFSGPNCQDGTYFKFEKNFWIQILFKINISECGLTFVNSNLKVIGGFEANRHSWPSMVLIIFNYTYTFSAPNQISQIKVSFGYCGASLIDRYTILTAAHCLSTRLTVEYNSKNYALPIEKNQFHDSLESVYWVYFGVHNITEALLSQDNSIKRPVSKLIIVKSLIMIIIF